MRFDTTSERSSPEENRILQTIPGVNENCAATILAEIGPTVTSFPSDTHLYSMKIKEQTRKLAAGCT